MSAPLVTVPLPTVTDRAEWFDKAVAAYERHANVEILIFRDRDACGPAWLEGADAGSGDYIHFGADDVEMHPGWWEAAAKVCDRGLLPAPLVFNSDGSVQSCGGAWGELEPDGAVTEFTRGPFVSRKQWEVLRPLVAPFLERAHYWTDNIFTWAGRQLGIETVICQGYAYTHHMVPERRQTARAGTDGHLYNLYTAGEALP